MAHIFDMNEYTGGNHSKRKTQWMQGPIFSKGCEEVLFSEERGFQ